LAGNRGEIAGRRLCHAARTGLRLHLAVAAAAAAGVLVGPLGRPAEPVVHRCSRCVARTGLLLHLAVAVVVIAVVGLSRPAAHRCAC
jgi:hypothetical protein